MSALLRSAKFLRLFSGFARNFTAGSVRNETENLLGNHKQQWQGIDARSLSTQPSSQPVQFDGINSNGLQSLDRALQKLDLDIRRTGRISQKDVEDVYEEVRVTGSISSSQSLLLIRCCGNLVAEELPEQRTQLVQNIWQTLQSIGVPMDISHYNALLRVYLENEHPFSPTDFLAYLRSQGVEPNRVTYQRLISRYCLQGDIEGATKILEHMKENGLAINEQVFNALVIGHARANDLESAQAMVTMMKRAHLEPTAETFRHLACAHAQRGDLAGLRQVLQLAEQEEVTLHDRDLLEIVFSLTLAGHKDHLTEVMSLLKRSAGFNQDAVTVILRLVNAGHDDVAFSLLKIMVPPQSATGEAPNIGNFFIRQMVRARRPPDVILHFCRQLHDENMNPKAVLVALHKALQLGHLPLAEGLLQALPEHGFSVRPHYFWPLLAAARSANNVPEVLRVVRLMRDLQCGVGQETLVEQVYPGMERLVRWDALLYELRECGVPYSITAPALCRYLLSHNQLALATTVADRFTVAYNHVSLRRPLAETYAETRDPGVVQLLHHLYNSAAALNTAPAEVMAAFLDELVPLLKTERAEAMETLLQTMLARGLGITASCAESVQSRLADSCTDRCCQLLEQLSQPQLTPAGPPEQFAQPAAQQELPAAVRLKRREGTTVGATTSTAADVARLEKAVEEARSEGEPAAPHLIRLLRALVNTKQLDRALQVKQELDACASTEHELPLGQEAALCDALIDAERLEDALKCYNDLLSQRPNALNDWRVLRLARLMVLGDKVDDAVSFLRSQPRDSLQRDQEDRRLFMAAWRLLNVPAEKGDVEAVRRLMSTLQEERYVAELNRALLAMLIKAHLANDDTDGAMQEMERVFKEHRQLPWRSQMMARLIQEENTDQLQRLMDLSMEAYGEMDALYDLAFSFIECGKTRQAKKVLETPGLRARHQRLELTCERYVEEGRVGELENLVSVTRDVYGVDRLKLYEYLLRAHCAVASPPDRALAVWTALQEEGLSPTDLMLGQLAGLLRHHGHPVPFVVPEPQLNRPPPPISQMAASGPAAVPADSSTSVTTEPPQNTIKSKLKRAIKAQNIDEALAVKQQMEVEGVDPAIHDLSLLVEMLVRADRIKEASGITSNMLRRGTFPQPRVFKFLMSRMAADGDVEGISNIGAHLTEELKSATSYDNRLCTAHLNAGQGEQYLQHLERASADCSATYVFPSGGFLGMLRALPDQYQRCVNLADAFASRGVYGAANMLWVDHFVNERYEQAQKIFDQYLHSQEIILFRSVLETVADTNNLEMAKRLYDMLNPTQISHGAKAVVLSSVVNLSLDRGDSVRDTLATIQRDGFSVNDLRKPVRDRLVQLAADSGIQLPPAPPADSAPATDSAQTQAPASGIQLPPAPPADSAPATDSAQTQAPASGTQLPPAPPADTARAADSAQAPASGTQLPPAPPADSAPAADFTQTTASGNKVSSSAASPPSSDPPST